MYVFSLIYIYIDIESFPFFPCYFHLPSTLSYVFSRGSPLSAGCRSSRRKTLTWKLSYDVWRNVPWQRHPRYANHIFISNAFSYVLSFYLFNIPYPLYYIYAIFKIKVKVMAYILHIYMCRNSNGVNVCLCVFWNVFVLSLSMFATAPIFLETHVVESPRPSRSGAEHQWWQDWGGEQPAAFPPWPHPCQ